MKKWLNPLFLLCCLPHALWALELRPGDVLLMELRCYSCSIIADETDSRFSHSGVVLGKHGGETIVAQALGRVHALPLQRFLQQKQRGSSVLVRRPFEALEQAELINEFNSSWQNRPFDSAYTWDDEKLYCSEFVAKFLEVFLGPVFPAAPLDFSRNWDYWSQVMNPVPQGELGNSPGDFERSEALQTVGELF